VTRSFQVSAPPIGGTVLRELVAPMAPEVFVEQWWGRRAVAIKGDGEKFSALFDRERFMLAVRQGADRPHLPTFRLSAIVRDFDDAWTRTEVIDPEEIPAALAEGSTICVNDISAADESLARFCQAVRQEMHFAGMTRCNAYLSENDSGVDTHIDTSITTALQLEGRKRWRFGKAPVVPWPRSNAQVQRDGTRVWSLPWVGHEPWERLDELQDEDFDEVVLEPGDLLCLPAGTWHRTRAMGDSLALNLAFSPLDFFTVLCRLIEPLFEGSPAWRGGLPPAYADGHAAEEVPPGVGEYLDARIGELVEGLRGVTSHDEAVATLWQALTR
jgi:ribosomal protein L16 Arg81 hydroxylase